MFNKAKILKTLKDLDLPDDKYWVSFGADLVLRGLKEETRDIDLGIDSDLATVFEQNGLMPYLTVECCRWFHVTDGVDAYENWSEGPVDYIDGIPCTDLKTLMALKMDKARKKDMDDVSIIMKYLIEQESAK